MLTPVGYFVRNSMRFPGREKAAECPEGIARLYALTVRAADEALAYGQLPGGRPPEQQDNRTMQAFEAVRQLREEEV